METKSDKKADEILAMLKKKEGHPHSYLVEENNKRWIVVVTHAEPLSDTGIPSENYRRAVDIGFRESQKTRSKFKRKK